MNALSRESFKFMAELWQENSKPWFDANRGRYDNHVLHPMRELAAVLEGPVSHILPEFNGNAKLSRINNDLRFTPNKPPYKQHMWISFGERGAPADFFAAIGGSGWAAGVGIGSPQRNALDGWRRNLIHRPDQWQGYISALNTGRGIQVFPEKPYRKPLFKEIPDQVFDLVQAREIWLVEAPKLTFEDDPAREFFRGLCRVLPLYLFMILDQDALEERLGELCQKITAPDEEVKRLWKGMRRKRR